jgi:hypothetical protein
MPYADVPVCPGAGVGEREGLIQPPDAPEVTMSALPAHPGERVDLAEREHVGPRSGIVRHPPLRASRCRDTVVRTTDSVELPVLTGTGRRGAAS